MGTLYTTPYRMIMELLMLISIKYLAGFTHQAILQVLM